MNELFYEVLDDCYTRYGLAVLLVRNKLRSLDEIASEEQLSKLLIETLEHCASHFRMKTANDPEIDDKLIFENISNELLDENSKLVQSSGMADKGLFLFPSALIIEEKSAKHSYNPNQKIRQELSQNKSLRLSNIVSKGVNLRTIKVNGGGSLSSPSSTLLYAACSAITAMTPMKPAFYDYEKSKNCAIIPDLPLDKMIVFVELFNRMQTSSVNLMVATVRRNEKKDDKNKMKVKFQRPLIHHGNYPNAPKYPKLLGGVGLIASIGLWAQQNEMTKNGNEVLKSLENVSLYLVAADGTSEEHFKNPIIKLAYSGELANIIRSLSFTARKISTIENDQLLFIFHASRFMQQFNQTYFKSFLSIRAEYEHWLLPLIKEYFMTTENISKELVLSATALGKWLNSICYFAAKNKLGKASFDEIAKEKNKYIAELESTIMASKSSIDLASRISTRGGRMAHSDMPVEVLPFLQASAWGEIEHKVAQQLVISFMRVRGEVSNNKDSNKEEKQTELIQNELK